MQIRLGILAVVLTLPVVASCSQQANLAQAPTTNPVAAAPALSEGMAEGAKTTESAAPTAKLASAQAGTTDAGMPSGVTGRERDGKGCTGSAGYAWSHLLGQCIRIFESGIRMDPRAKSLDKTLSAFAVFAPGDDARAEIFLPGRAPVILARDGDKQAWRDGAYMLTRAKRNYALTDIGGAKLYEGTAK